MSVKPLSAAEMDSAWPPEALDHHNTLAPLTGFILKSCVDEVCGMLPETGSIVELGAGAGYIGSLLPERYRHRSIQTEIGQANCRNAQENNPDLATLCAKAQELPFRAGSIGGIIARNVLDMVDTQAVVYEAARVIRPGGLFVHMRDHRPSLVWIQEQLAVGASKVLAPYFDSASEFQRYQVVSQSSLKQFATPDNQRLLNNMGNPHFQEYVSGRQRRSTAMGGLMLLSKRVSSCMERTTPLFTEIMDKKVGSLLKKAGFEPAFSVFAAENMLPKTYALAHDWPEGGNCLEGYNDGSFAVYDNPELPKDVVYVSQEIGVVTAKKVC